MLISSGSFSRPQVTRVSVTLPAALLQPLGLEIERATSPSQEGGRFQTAMATGPRVRNPACVVQLTSSDWNAQCSQLNIVITRIAEMCETAQIAPVQSGPGILGYSSPAAFHTSSRELTSATGRFFSTVCPLGPFYVHSSSGWAVKSHSDRRRAGVKSNFQMEKPVNRYLFCFSFFVIRSMTSSDVCWRRRACLVESCQVVVVNASKPGSQSQGTTRIEISCSWMMVSLHLFWREPNP